MLMYLKLYSVSQHRYRGLDRPRHLSIWAKVHLSIWAKVHLSFRVVESEAAVGFQMFTID